MPQTRFHGEVCSSVVSEDGRGVAGEVKDGSRGSAGDNGMGHDIFLPITATYCQNKGPTIWLRATATIRAVWAT